MHSRIRASPAAVAPFFPGTKTIGSYIGGELHAAPANPSDS